MTGVNQNAVVLFKIERYFFYITRFVLHLLTRMPNNYPTIKVLFIYCVLEEKCVVMRRPFFIFAILLLAMISVDISAQTTDLKFFFSVDSASPLFIGPSVEAGVVLEEVHRVGVRIRLPGLGLESQLIAKAQSYYPLSQWITPWSVGIDVCYSGSLLFNNKHKLYYGGSIGVQFTETRNYWYDSQSPYHRSFRDWHLPIIAVAGYEKTIDDRRYYRLGALIGLAVGLAGTDDARSVGFSITQYQPNTYFFFAAQAIFGWNF